jgi:hypothetical protein
MNLLVVAIIFIATLVCNALGVIYQKCVTAEKHLKATTISVVMAGLSLYIWKCCLSEDDLVSSGTAITSYLCGDGIGTYAGLRYKSNKA